MNLSVDDIVALGGMAGALLGVKELIMRFINRKSERKRLQSIASAAEADSIAKFAAEWKELYEEKDRKAAEKDEKIDKLYEDINQYRNTIASLREEITDLKIMNTKLLVIKCLVKGCGKRRPPSDYLNFNDDETKQQEEKKQ